MVLTSDLQEFVAVLVPGDVLMFDTLHPVSAAIKFAENRPVNHCALHTADGAFLHVSGHPRDPRRALEDGTLKARLASRYDRSVTALRHSAVQHRDGAPDKDGATWAMMKAAELVENSTDYSYLSIASLVVPCFCRAYRRYLSPLGSGAARPAGRISRNVDGLAVALVELTARLGQEADVATQLSGLQTLTCSEFVYVCLSADGHRVAVPNNLVQWSLGIRAPAGGLGVRAASTEGAVEFSSTWIDFNAALRDDPPQPGVGVRTSGSPPLVLAARKVVIELFKYNFVLGKYGPIRKKPQKSSVSDETVCDFVTPGDLWSSGSLSPVAVFHRPPSPEDGDLDGRPTA